MASTLELVLLYLAAAVLGVVACVGTGSSSDGSRSETTIDIKFTDPATLEQLLREGGSQLVRYKIP